MKKIFFLLIVPVVFMHGATAQSGYKLANTFHSASDGGWDYIFANSKSNKLYVSHAAQVNVLDKTTGDSLGIIPNTQGVHGIAAVNKLNKGYTSNGRANTVTVFDLSSEKILNQIATGENPDAIFYDTYSKKIITCNGRSKDLSIIDPTTDKVVATIAVGGKPETAVSDNAGKIFVNIEDKNEIVAIDIKKNEVIAHWSLGGAEGPTGLAIDTDTKRLFAGCEEKLAVMDATNGNIVTTIAIGAGCDGVAFDNSAKTIFTSNGGAATISVIKEASKDKFELIENIPTKKGARTICIDDATKALYLPAADYEPQASGAQGRPKMVSGSFQILVFKKK
ncbi:MAG: YncE family protein [Chitinophagaceae bacterium]|jgi:YVTN family beta-propeller protein|nr:YncE family protein [Chitinophagaceae bacterium]